jgi:uncharacterized phosphosugar-binding protein
MSFAAYIESLTGILQSVAANQADNIRRAGFCVAEAIHRGGIVHIFGTGHSHLIAEEAFFRARGLVPVNPILHPRLVFLCGALDSTRAEREPGFSAQLIAAAGVTSNDAALIVSNSGRNAAPVEMALEMKSRGVRTIAITSLRHSQSAPATHSSGKLLFELADIVIDNGAPPGDALLTLAGVTAPIGPVSTVTGAAIVHSIIIEAAMELARRHVDVPVFQSANLPDAEENILKKLMEPYRGRIRYFDWPDQREET